MGASPRRLVLWRHGQTEWNLTNRSQGHTDIDLDDTGRAQAAEAAPALAQMAPARLWTSDLRRAHRTAAYLAELTGLVAVADPRLREYDVGIRAGLTKQEWADRFPREYAAWLAEDETQLVEGEESTEQVRSRMHAALSDAWDALRPGESGVVVTHGACLKVGLMSMLGWPWEMARSLRGLDNCCWATLTDHPMKPGLRLAAYNQGARPHGTDGPDFTTDGAIG